MTRRHPPQAITTNLGIVCFTSEKLVQASRSFRVVWFIVIEHFAVGAKVIAAAIVPDCPDEVKIQLARQELIIEKIIEGKKDEMSEIIEYMNDQVRVGSPGLRAYIQSDAAAQLCDKTTPHT